MKAIKITAALFFWFAAVYMVVVIVLAALDKSISDLPLFIRLIFLAVTFTCFTIASRLTFKKDKSNQPWIK